MDGTRNCQKHNKTKKKEKRKEFCASADVKYRTDGRGTGYNTPLVAELQWEGKLKGNIGGGERAKA